MPACAEYGPICSSAKRSNCSRVSQTSTTRRPSSVFAAQWKIAPSGAGADGSSRPISFSTSSYCSSVPPLKFISIATAMERTSLLAVTYIRVDVRKPAFTGSSLPLDCRRRLRGQVERDPVHARDLVDDPAGDRLQQVVGQARPVGGHRVLGGDRPDHDRVSVGALVALDADGADRGQHREALPELAVEAGLAHLREQDRVRLAEYLQPFAGDVADD